MPSNLKILIAYYSRTGTTKKLALEMSKCVENCEIEEIVDMKNRAGSSGYLASGSDAVLRKLANIKEVRFDPRDFDLVIIGTPVWVMTVSSPVRTYLSIFKNSFKRVAFFCTMGSMGDDAAFRDMEKISGKKPLAVFSVKSIDMAQNTYSEELREFIDDLIKKIFI